MSLKYFNPSKPVFLRTHCDDDDEEDDDDIYLLQLGFHPVAAAGRFVQK